MGVAYSLITAWCAADWAGAAHGAALAAIGMAKYRMRFITNLPMHDGADTATVRAWPGIARNATRGRVREE
ncbi:hypothetical protein GCM10007863_25300 [Dyella mobilis]|nr:hypothetical protein GCM10007863_25300 [Dyella mobilis]